MEIALKTGRGIYFLKQAAPADYRGGALVLTLALERADGIERVVFKCEIAAELVHDADSAAVLKRLAPWIEREFEMTRETALKIIRNERKLYEIAFDPGNHGPF